MADFAGIGAVLVDAIRLYREYQKDRLAGRITITEIKICWREVTAADNVVYKRQYLYLTSDKVHFYLYVVKLGKDIQPGDTFDNVYYERCEDNVVIGAAGRRTRWFTRNILGRQNDHGEPIAAISFSDFVLSVMYDTLHYALTLDDLSPDAVTAMIGHANILVSKLGNDPNPRIYTNWDTLDNVPTLHAMIVVKNDFEPVDVEGPRRFEVLQQLANLRAGGLRPGAAAADVAAAAPVEEPAAPVAAAAAPDVLTMATVAVVAALATVTVVVAALAKAKRVSTT